MDETILGIIMNEPALGIIMNPLVHQQKTKIQETEQPQVEDTITYNVEKEKWEKYLSPNKPRPTSKPFRRLLEKNRFHAIFEKDEDEEIADKQGNAKDTMGDQIGI
ncbi:hypothetical protein CHS0354_022492 [Potamilus streckersoni]|uniref:Uncharacterized protein n=1 Tax=Potamilus streckersoni TaxID=2493646 RepID=A0AAE0SXK2_9BIVA|nr:hypothetical protein CHS0354_022492 [Potamilus streckersoni]